MAIKEVYVHNSSQPSLGHDKDQLEQQQPTPTPSSTNTTSLLSPLTQTPEPKVHEAFKPIVSVENFFSDEQSLPLSLHSLEQSPCYTIIGSKPAGNHTMYYCEVHPREKRYNFQGSSIFYLH